MVGEKEMETQILRMEESLDVTHSHFQMDVLLTYSDNDGKVPGERAGHEGLGEPPDVGLGSKMIGLETLVARCEGHGGGERDTNHLHEVQMTS